MRISALLLSMAMLAVAACGGSGGASATDGSVSKGDVQADSRPLPPVSDVLALIYDPQYRVPDNFFVDQRAGTPVSYTMHHVLDDSRSFEVCSDDFATALAIEEADNASRSVQGRFVTAVETSRYFEVVRELAYDAAIGNVADTTSPGFARVFKCSDTQRDGVDRASLEGYAGHINARPLSAEATRVFTEYLWQFSFFPATYRKVLESFDTSDERYFRRTLRLGFATRDGACDRIEVVDWTFATDAGSGATEMSWELRESFDARLENGSPVLCD